MRETERRIQLYRARLPKIREKIIATLLIFAVSAAAMAVATFSWVTLSMAPQVQGASTSVVANGNLEIALATNSTAPDASKIGDGALDLAQRNLTWGNLINLSDLSYGLNNIVLRPAGLSTDSEKLLYSPLYAVKYGDDGRVMDASLGSSSEDQNWGFGYTLWNGEAFLKPESDDTRGVRAIASVKYTAYPTDSSERDKEATRLRYIADTHLNNSRAGLENLSSSFGSISGLMGAYMCTILEDNPDRLCSGDDIRSLHALMEKLHDDVMLEAFEALKTMFEIYQLDTVSRIEKHNEDPAKTPITTYTPHEFTSVDDFLNNATAELAAMNAARNILKQSDPAVGQIVFTTVTEMSTSSLEQYISDMRMLEGFLDDFEKDGGYLARAETIKWSEIDTMINALVHIDSCKLNGKLVSYYASNLSEAVSLVMSGDTHEAVIYQGLVKRVDQWLHSGTALRANNVTISIPKKTIGEAVKNKNDSSLTSAWNGASFLLPDPVTIKANISTSSVTDYPTSIMDTDYSNVKAVAGSPIRATDYVMQDTYGLALDFWVRTNGKGSYLILEGEPETEPRDVYKEVTWIDEDNNPVTENVQISLTTITTTTTYPEVEGQEKKEPEKKTEVNVEVYQRPGDAASWYYLKDHTKVSTGSVNHYTDETNTVIEKTVTVSMSDPEPSKEDVVIGYSGTNRIWGAEGDEDGKYLTDYSTTQGSGSCYTFYASSPDEVGRILTLLSAMKIAFVNGQTGELLATASLATELKYEDVGKVIVPIMLDDDERTNTTVGDQTLLTITSLTANEPMLISALIYLDGTKVFNDMVLADSDISASLNIQFGAYTAPDAMKDDQLSMQELIASAKVGKGEDGELLDKIEFDKDETDLSIRVALAIEGNSVDSDSKVQASFIRKINSTQGTRQETMEFRATAANESGSEWIVEHEFTAPGEYLLREITVDGIEYDLQATVSVLVPGVGVSRVISLDGIGSSYTHMTSDNYVSESFQITITDSSNASHEVKGIFTNTSNASMVTEYTAKGNGVYEANIVFSSSDTYTMQYVSIDGDYYEVTPYTREVYVGLRTEIYISTDSTEFKPEEDLQEYVNGINFEYKFANKEHTFDVSAVILDNKNNVVPGLVGVILQYTNGLDTDLTWNPTTRRYAGGQFLVTAVKKYEFEQMTVTVAGGTEIIDMAIKAPMITVVPTQPVEYLGVDGGINTHIQSLHADAKTGTISLSFKNASSSDVFGKFSRRTTVNGTPEYYILKATYSDGGATRSGDIATYADGDAENTNIYTFTLPHVEGYWKLEGVKMDNVLKDSVFYSIGDADNEKDADGNPIYIEASNSKIENISNKFDNINGYYNVVDSATASWNQQITQITNVYISELEKTPASGSTPATYYYQTRYTNGFMQPITLGANDDEYKFKVVGFDNNEIKPVNGTPSLSDITLTFKHIPSSMQAYYTIADTSTDVATSISNGVHSDQTATLTLGFEGNSNSTIAVTAGDTLYFAGDYTALLNYKINYIDINGAQKSTSSSKTMSNITLASDKPEVKVVGVDPTPTTKLTLYAQNVPVGGGPVLNSDNIDGYNSFTDYYATVYLHAKSNNKYTVVVPSVKLQILGMPSSFTASMSFPTAATVGEPAVYQFTSNNQQVQKSIGAKEDGANYIIEDKNPRIYPIGCQTVSTMTVVYGGVTYEVGLKHAVTIDQPSCAPHVKFNSTANDQTLPTTPDMIYGTLMDDGTRVVTLPGSQSWTESKSSTTNGTFTVQSGYPQEEACYVVKDNGCDADTYQAYKKITTVSKATGSTSTWTRSWEIVGWKIGNKTYQPGETVPITGSQTATAVLKYTDGAKTTTSTTTTRTEYYYTASGGEVSSKPSGFSIADSETAYTSTNPHREDVVS